MHRESCGEVDILLNFKARGVLSLPPMLFSASLREARNTFIVKLDKKAASESQNEMMESESADRLIEVIVMEADAVSNDIMLKNEAAETVEGQHLTN